jgi:SAM-dependent methyltransferase
LSTRLEREREFHDRTFAADARASVAKFYEIERYEQEFYRALLARYGAGGEALEYGCGPVSAARFLARRGTSVTGIDLSEVAIERAAEEARREGVAGRCAFRLMNAERLEFEESSFDLICGTGILHHLDLDGAYSEIARTLRPTGHAVFVEPLGHNPVINLYRRRTPELRTEDEHPLLTGDLERARAHFGRVGLRHFHLLTLFAVPFRRLPGFGALLGALNAADRALFRIRPLRKHAWTVVITLSMPAPGSPLK